MSAAPRQPQERHSYQGPRTSRQKLVPQASQPRARTLGTARLSLPPKREAVLYLVWERAMRANPTTVLSVSSCFGFVLTRGTTIGLELTEL